MQPLRNPKKECAIAPSKDQLPIPSLARPVALQCMAAARVRTDRRGDINLVVHGSQGQSGAAKQQHKQVGGGMSSLRHVTGSPMIDKVNP